MGGADPKRRPLVVVYGWSWIFGGDRSRRFLWDSRCGQVWGAGGRDGCRFFFKVSEFGDLDKVLCPYLGVSVRVDAQILRG